ncbi:NADH dehydrogenase [ubiquinone] iron-sulfur protein 5 [Chrysoperla carnea]|uniref:NADH dehydrogenase [ubiquinone] iron-sulfur protein 5 n=1 Tax=Chrysoperla carnea TaxID=189513 RepID=UPI001D088EE1|nr:NADH dehydrogenase [ubiquinone] iron-sulfur protein 5 [Chrysoperla carnea]
MSLAPFFKTPLTDLTGCIINNQNFGKCADLELKYMDCIEAYGLDRGKKKCEVLMEDFKECHLKTKQFKRLWEMRKERHRQYLLGESKEHYAEPPKVDSF